MNPHKLSFFLSFAIIWLLFSHCDDQGPNAYSEPSTPCANSVDTSIYDLVNTLQDSIGDKILLGQTLEELMDSLSTAGDPSQLGIAYAQYRRGVAASRAKDDSTAIAWYRTALENFLLCADADPNWVTILYKNLAAKYYTHKSQFDKAFHWAQAGIDYTKQWEEQDTLLGNRHFELYLFAGRAKRKLGDPQSALDYYQLARQIVPDSKVSTYLKAQMADEQGLAYLERRDLDSAQYYSHLAEELITSQGDLYPADSSDWANVLNNRWIIYRESDLDSIALSSILGSIALNTRLNNKGALALNYNNLGNSYKDIDQFNNAIPSLRKAVAINLASDQLFELAKNYDNLGDCLWQTGQLDSALYYYEQAITLFSGIPGGTSDLTQLAYKGSAIAPVASRARMLTQKHFDDAGETPLSSVLSAFEDLDQLVVALRQDIRPEASKMLTTARMKPLYEEAIAFCHRAWEAQRDPAYLEAALQFTERSKSLILQEELKAGQLLETLVSAEDAQQLRTSWGEQTFFYQQSLNQNLSDVERAEYAAAYQEKTIAVQQLQDQIREDYPSFDRYLLSQAFPGFCRRAGPN